MQSTTDEISFKEQLAEQGIDTVVRRNAAGRIYGITFIDYNSKTVCNGSRLGKELSANSFNDRWNNIRQEIKEPAEIQVKVPHLNDMEDLPLEKHHHYFDFINTEKHEDGLIEVLGSLLPSIQGEDYEEQDFAYKMKKKKTNKKR